MKHEKLLKALTLVGKVVGTVGAFNQIPGVSPQTGVIIFLAASCIKDVVNRIGDFLDDGQSNGSFKA